MHRRIAAVVIAGLMAGVFHNIPSKSLLFAWAPFLPLMAIGLCEGAKSALKAGLIAIFISLLVGREQSAFNMTMFVVLPTVMFTGRLLRYQTDASGQREWYPTLRAIADLTLLCAGMFMAFSLIVSIGHKESLQSILKSNFTPDLAALEPESAEIMRKLTGEWSFMLFALAGWLWITSTWLLAYFIHLGLRHPPYMTLRPNISLEIRGVPNWFLYLMGLSALLAVLGGPNDSFTGSTVFLILMLPYFLSGMAAIHAMSRQWKPRKFWLFLIYIVLVFQFWTTIFVALAGLYYHLFETLDKPQKMR